MSETLPKFKLVATHTARRSFATNLYKSGFSNYYKIRKDAFLTHKRSVEGSSYFKRLDKLQKLKIEELKNKDR